MYVILSCKLFCQIPDVGFPTTIKLQTIFLVELLIDIFQDNLIVQMVFVFTKKTAY